MLPNSLSKAFFDYLSCVCMHSLQIFTSLQMDGQTARWMGKRSAGRSNGRSDRRSDGRSDRWSDGWKVGQSAENYGGEKIGFAFTISFQFAKCKDVWAIQWLKF